MAGARRHVPSYGRSAPAPLTRFGPTPPRATLDPADLPPRAQVSGLLVRSVARRGGKAGMLKVNAAHDVTLTDRGDEGRGGNP